MRRLRRAVLFAILATIPIQATAGGLAQHGSPSSDYKSSISEAVRDYINFGIAI